MRSSIFESLKSAIQSQTPAEQVLEWEWSLSPKQRQIFAYKQWGRLTPAKQHKP